jgi:hypothetical protein
VLELIGHLLGDEYAPHPANSYLTTEQWMNWCQLASDREQELIAAMMQVAERERANLPKEMAAMPAWAESLVLATLDEMGMA